MTIDSGRSTPLRQFRVTITEDLHEGERHAHLSWRTFPCAATKWDGAMWYRFPSSSLLAVTSQEALRDLLQELGSQPWHEGRYPRH